MQYILKRVILQSISLELLKQGKILQASNFVNVRSYACGRWPEVHETSCPGWGYLAYNWFNDESDNDRKKIRDTFRSTKLEEIKSDAIKQAKLFYDSCLDTGNLANSIGIEFLIKIKYFHQVSMMSSVCSHYIPFSTSSIFRKLLGCSPRMSRILSTKRLEFLGFWEAIYFSLMASFVIQKIVLKILFIWVLQYPAHSFQRKLNKSIYNK